MKKDSDVVIVDLPGIYSLSPYTQEEVIARNYLLDEKPEAILNIVDGTNLYLSMQLFELGIPMVIAININDLVGKNEDRIDIQLLSQTLGCPVMEISAIKGESTLMAVEEVLKVIEKGNREQPPVFMEEKEKRRILFLWLFRM